MDEVEDGLVVAIKVPSDLSSWLRSHLLDDVEHLFEAEAILAEERVREVVEVGLALFALILLGVFTGRTPLDNGVTLAVDARLRLAKPGETETLEASLTQWKEDLS